MKWPIKLLLLVSSFSFLAHASAKKLPIFNERKDFDNLRVDSTVIVCNDLLTKGTPPTDTTWKGGYDIVSAIGRVILGVKKNSVLCLPDTFTFTISLKVKFWNQRAHCDSTTIDLEVNYNKYSGISYREKSIYRLDSACYIHVQILNISDTTLRKYVYIEAQVEEERYYRNFNPSLKPSFTLSYLPSSDEIEITLADSLVYQADEYEIEWTFVTGYTNSGTRGTKAVAEAAYSFKRESARVGITGLNYKVTNIFDKGYLVFRVRAVGHGGEGYLHRIAGDWSIAETGANLTGKSSCYILIDSAEAVAPHERTLAWQYICEFSEDGRKKELINYYDGSSRARQFVTRSQTDTTAIVAETIYDLEGRPVVNVLPAPSFQNIIKFYPGFNLNRSGSRYSYIDFEQDNLCESYTDSMKVSSGASRYFSSSNPLITQNVGSSSKPNPMDYVPNAFGFPFTQTLYVNDNTGRVASQGGIGIDHQVASGHDTRYYYAIPFQPELDRLFGNEVGENIHYKKIMVIDPNGQVSISYENISGQTIATALSATSPSNVQALASNEGSGEIDVNLKSSLDTLYSEESVVISKTFLVDEDGKEHKLYYSVVPAKYFPECNAEDICYDCVYDLEISLIEDKCGNQMIKGSGDTIKVLKRTIGHTPDTACTSGAAYSFADDTLLITGTEEAPIDTFLVMNLQRGSYTLVKTLTVNKESYNYYLNDFITNRVCKTKEDFEQEAWERMDTSGCYFTCEVCNEKLGTQADYVTARITNHFKTGRTPTEEDTTNYIHEYSVAKAKCAQLCEDENPSPCAVYLEIMKADVTPGGQYAQYMYDPALQAYVADSTTGYYNLLITTVANTAPTSFKTNSYFSDKYLYINGALRSYSSLTVDEFVNHWRAEFADYLVQFHPEYCKFKWCDNNKANFVFDESFLSTDLYANALDSGYLNPLESGPTDAVDVFFRTDSTGEDAWTILDDKMHNYIYTTYHDTDIFYTMWEVPISMIFCDHLGGNETARRACVTLHADSFENCPQYKDMYWRYFRSLYYSAKQHIVDSMRGEFVYNTIACECPMNPEGYVERFPQDQTEYDLEELYGQVEQQMLDTCASMCRAYAAAWEEKLKHCDIDSTELALIIDSLVQVCSMGCSSQTPFGSSTVTQQYQNAPSVTFKSFHDVLTSLLIDEEENPKNIYVKGLCDDISLNMPARGGHDYFATLSPFADTCACDENLYNMPLHFATGSCPDTVTVKNNNCPCTQAGNKKPASTLIAAQNDQEEQYKCKNCVSCEGFRNAYQSFYSTYDTFNLDRPAHQNLFKDFINNYLGFNLQFKDYLDFAADCGGVARLYTDTVPHYSVDTVLSVYRGIYMIYRNNYLLSSIDNFTNYKQPTFDYVPRFSVRTHNTMLAQESWKIRPVSFNLVNRPYSDYLNDANESKATSSDKNNSVIVTASINADPTAMQKEKWIWNGRPDILSVKRVSRVMDEEGTPGIDSCGCNLILSAVKLFNTGTFSVSSASQLFSNMYNQGEVLPNFDSLARLCCRAARGLTGQVPFTGEGCTLPDNWGLGQWHSSVGTEGATKGSILSTISGANPNLKMPGRFACIPQCKQKIDKCGCDTILNEYQRYLAEEPEEDFATWFASENGGDPIENIMDILALCQTAKAASGGTNWNQLGLDILTAETSDDETYWLIPQRFACEKTEECDPIEPDTTIYVGDERVIWPSRPTVGCSDILNTILATIASTGLTSSIWDYESNSVFRDSVLIRLNNKYGGDPYNRSFDYTSLFLAMRSECWCTFFPTLAECKLKRPTPNPIIHPVYGDSIVGDSSHPIFPLGIRDTCGNCYMPTPLLGLLQQYLDTLTHPAVTFGNGTAINKLCMTNWEMHPNYRRYYNTALYTGTHANELIYDIPQFTYYEKMRLRMDDENGNVRTVNLYFTTAMGRNNFLRLKKIYDVRPIVIACDTLIKRFIAKAVMQRGPNINPPYYDTILIAGEVSDWILARPTSCQRMCLKLCNKPIMPIGGVIQYDPCRERLRVAAKFNADAAWSQYLDSVSTAFKYKYYSKCMRARNSEKFRLKYNERQYHYTLYYYDQAGNLVKTVPPAGVQPITDQGTLDDIVDKRLSGDESIVRPSHTLVTDYRYTTLNQINAQKTPDAGVSTFYYDVVGRLVVSQNSKQAASDYYSYTQFDNLGRISEEGEIKPASSMTTMIAKNASSLNVWLASTDKRQIVNIYYDKIDWTVIDTILFKQENLRARVSYSTYREYNSLGYDHAIHYSYDVDGNVKKLLRETPSLKVIGQDYKLTQYEYDLFSSKVNNVIYQKDELDQYIQKYEYNADMRLAQVYSGPSFEALDLDAKYYYYLHGPLARTELGDHFVQGVDFAYTIQGWLKAVNGSAVNHNRDIGLDGNTTATNNVDAGFARDVFAFSLSYFNGDYSSIQNFSLGNQFEASLTGSAASESAPSLYNGNIRMMSVGISKFGTKPLLTAYNYDQLNRLTTVNAWTNYDSSANSWSNTGNAINDYHNRFTYDANGNILTQVRRGSGVTIAMDSLGYEYYASTNRLKKVTDAVSVGNYTDDIDSQSDANNYKYDEIGNLVRDISEEIDTIFWNVYGKISRIRRTSGSTKPDLEFQYTPDGHRAIKVVIPKGSIYRTYTYYSRDAHGNILATYTRNFAKIIDYDSISYSSINDTLINEVGANAFGGFISDRYDNDGLADALMASVISTSNQTEVLDEFDLYDFLNDDMMANLALVIAEYSDVTLVDVMAEYCGSNGYSEFLQYLCDNGDDITNYYIDNASFDYYTALISIDATSFENLYFGVGGPIFEASFDYSAAILWLQTYSNTTAVRTWLNANWPNFTECTTRMAIVTSISNNSTYIDMWMSTLSSFATSVIGFTNSYSRHSDVYNELLAYNAGVLRLAVYSAFDPDEILEWYRYDQRADFIHIAAAIVSDSVAPWQESNATNSMEEYFGYIKDHFGQIAYDNILIRYLNVSRVYLDSFTLAEHHIYGSSRIGIYSVHVGLATIKFYADTSGGEFANIDTTYTYFAEANYGYYYINRGDKRYELTNHLGNVMTVISDKKMAYCSNDTARFYYADILSAYDYSAFGAPLPGRTYESKGYRFGFNNQEKVDEINDAGCSYAFGYRLLDSRLGRFLSVDPLTKSYPKNSPYAFAENKVIMCVDIEGLESGYSTMQMQGLISAGIPFVMYEFRKRNGYWERRNQYFNIDANRDLGAIRPAWSPAGGSPKKMQPEMTGWVSSLSAPSPFIHKATFETTISNAGKISHIHGIASTTDIVDMTTDMVMRASISAGKSVSTFPNADYSIPVPSTDPIAPDVGGTIQVINSTTIQTINTDVTIKRITLTGSWYNRRSIKAAAEDLQNKYPDVKISTVIKPFNFFMLARTSGPYPDGCMFPKFITGVEINVNAEKTVTTINQITDTKIFSVNNTP